VCCFQRNTEEATPLWKSNTPDSQDYEDVENVVWRKHQVCRYFSERGRFWTSDRKRTALKWLVTFIIGVLVGLVGLAVTYFTEELIVHKLNTGMSVRNASGHATRMTRRAVLDLTDDGQWAAGYFTMITWTFFFVLFANACVLWEPLAAGSGIPEVKCYLNGINLNKVVRIKTFLGKALGRIDCARLQFVVNETVRRNDFLGCKWIANGKGGPYGALRSNHSCRSVSGKVEYVGF
jgi:hypothetical protein